jgi:predicted AlkP superfamily phosphohydrolase/phosphomutase
MPHDTLALKEGIFDRLTFYSQAKTIFKERLDIFQHELQKFHQGIFVFYFDYLDIIQHVFGNTQDKKILLECYQAMDKIIGYVNNRIDKDTVFMVVSDHGFGPFNKMVNLNSWLQSNGFLFMKDGAKTSKEFFDNVDWSRTEAYAIGFGGIYINQFGRETQGIVYPGKETEQVKTRIINKLEQLVDPVTNKKIVKKVYTKEEIFSGKFEENAPDLFAGFYTGYRISWHTVLGETPEQIIEDNKKEWCCDHIFDPSLVPGVLFMNRKCSNKQPHIVDIIPSLYDILNISCKNVDGESFFKGL